MFVLPVWMTAFASLLILVTVYCKWSFQYWRKRNLPYLEPQVPFGNCYRCLSGQENWAVTMKRLYNKIKQNGWKHGGIYVFTSPNYVPADLDCVKNILARDFHYFTDRGGYFNDKANPLDGNLFMLGYSKWHRIKPKVSPSFTSMKLKMIFPFVLNSTAHLLENFNKEIVKNQPIDVKGPIGNFIMDIVASCVYGLNLQSSERVGSLFKEHATRISHPRLLYRLKLSAASNFPRLATYLGVSTIPKDMTDFFVTTTTDVVNRREESFDRRSDFLQSLIDLKNKKCDENDPDGAPFTMEDIAAQAIVFLVAGFETTSTAITFALYELAKHPKMQDRVRDEVLTVLEKYHGEMTYEAIREMTYLSQVFDETLRLYPSFPMINRKCVKDYKTENTVIEKGRIVIIPILAIHHDEEYYPNPEKFDPERFSEENKASRHKYAYLPFGGGPRTCTGLQFALMTGRMALGCLIRDFTFRVSSKTAEPITFRPNAFVLSAAGGIWLDAEKVI